MSEKVTDLQTKFVEFIPDELEQGTLYISRRFRTASHLCACGCGLVTVTPFNSEYGWELRIYPTGVSLHPSIGNQNFPCQSHYWIKNSRIVWA